MGGAEADGDGGMDMEDPVDRCEIPEFLRSCQLCGSGGAVLRERPKLAEGAGGGCEAVLTDKEGGMGRDDDGGG